MSYEFNIVVLGQNKYETLPVSDSFEFVTESQSDLRYHDTWDFMRSSQGLWYSLGRHGDIGFSALSFLDADFDGESEVCPYWVEGSSKSDLVPLIVRPHCRQELEHALKTLIGLSPLKMIYLMARMQGGDDEIVCGTMSLKQFWDLHDRKMILFNVCYILRELECDD